MNPTQAAPCATVIDLHAKACAELFAAYGLAQHLRKDTCAKDHATQRNYVSVMVATGEGIRLSSTISMDAGTLSCTHPARAGGLSDRDLEDWSRELNNQLTGRLKNKLLRLGCEVSAGLPVLVSGQDVCAIVAPDIDHRQYFFTSEHGAVVFTLAMLFAPDFAFPEKPEIEAEDVKAEGALALF
jgi:CheY-specific phosphatase CheX